jgi:hypothetical protein
LDGAGENKIVSTALLIYVFFSGQTSCSARNGGIREQQQVNGDVRRSTRKLIIEQGLDTDLNPALFVCGFQEVNKK